MTQLNYGPISARIVMLG